MGARIDLTFDCADPQRLAEFWKLALDYEDEPPPAPFETRAAWLASYGVPEDEWGDGAWLRDPSGLGPRLSLLRVPERKVVKNRLHIDIRVGAERISETVDRLAAAGATIVERFPSHHVVMADPEGNEFCVA